MKEPIYIYPQKRLPFWLGILTTLILITVYRITLIWPYALLSFFAFVYSVIIFFIINTWRIEIFEDKIVIISLAVFKEFFWKDISLTFITGKLSYSFGLYYWFFENFSKGRFGFNVNFFTRNQLQEIAQIVTNKCSEDNIDIKIWKISEGKFPWYIL